MQHFPVALAVNSPMQIAFHSSTIFNKQPGERIFSQLNRKQYLMHGMNHYNA